MAETNNVGSENTVSSTTGGNSNTVGSKNSTLSSTAKADNVEVVTSNTESASSSVASEVNAEVVPVPFPHNVLASVNTEATSYKDLVDEVYKEHEKELKSDKGNIYEPTPEMLAAREDAQIRLADELRASLKAQRQIAARKAGGEGTIKIKLSTPHIHNGIAYQAGDEILVDESSAKFIEEVKVGKRV